MGTRAALVTGTVLSAAVTAAWSWTAALTVGPTAPPALTRDLSADYAALAAAATGSSPWALLAVTAVIYALCLLASGLRARGRVLREAALLDLDDDETAEPATASAGRRH